MEGNTEDTSNPDMTEVAQPEAVANDVNNNSDNGDEEVTTAEVSENVPDTGAPDISDSNVDDAPASDAQETPKENESSEAEESNATKDDEQPFEGKAEDEKSTSTSGDTTPIGAKILMNRFSTWRKTANEKINVQAPVLQENAKQAQEYAQRMLKK
mmetsp:Transcript_3401/g.8105  ORF Transcript_3401/g.8105 Transcript_3401/m.8105 type:complete len:156 (+) Transcript_3401:165-632(+)